MIRPADGDSRRPNSSMSRRRLPLRSAPPSGFSGSEMLRLASLVLLLAVITMLYFRARDPDTWRFLARADRKPREAASQQDSAPGTEPTKSAPALTPTETVVPGPNDTDVDEQGSFREAAEAITDNEDLTREEMFAYWRLFEWARRTSFADLWKRANRNVLFVHLFDSPATHRGELVGLRLHVKRVLEHTDSPDTPEGATVYEAWGATDDSRTFPYCLVFPEKSSQLPLGDNIDEDALFAGYFLKVMKYTDKLGKIRGAPLLIGRLQWQENLSRRALQASREGSPWTFWILAVGFVGFLGLRWYLRRQAPPVLPASVRSPNEGAVSDWLDAAEAGGEEPPKPSTNGHSTPH